MVSHNLHEKLFRDSQVQMGSERSFGFVFAIVFFAIGVWRVHHGDYELAILFLALAAVFAFFGAIVPHILRPLNILWFWFGMKLQKIVSPIVLGMLFFMTVTPTALIFRLLRKDLLNMRIEKELDSYWIHRDPPGPKPRSMSKQF